MRKLSPLEIKTFRRKVYDYFRKNRREFAWRKTRDPYHVLVSEIMLQQTQVDRVEKKYIEFTELFPNFKSLSAAPLSRVVSAWQGLGYNRRALYLKNAAAAVMERHGGNLPETVEELQALPGIGPATARSIAAYAFNAPVAFIETNIRTVFIHEFFPKSKSVPDTRLLPLVEQTLDAADPWAWYNALMDYGAMLKATQGNLSRKSKHYVRQSSFADSNRRIRGEIVRHITRHGPLSFVSLCKRMPDFSPERIKSCLSALSTEKLLVRKKSLYHIAD